MLKDVAKFYYFDKGYNCSESLMLAINSYYNLNIGEESISLMTGFGGGMGCGKTCGGLTGIIATLGKMFPGDKKEVYEISKKLIAKYEEELGSSECSVLEARYKTPENRCTTTVEFSADIFERFIEETAPQYKK